MSRAHVLTVLNLKGGVGKTHTTWLLASVAQEQKVSIVTVDLDTQGNLTSSFATEGRIERALPRCSIQLATLIRQPSSRKHRLIAST